MKIHTLVAASLALSLASAANAHRLIDANEPVSVAKSDVTVVPKIDWNRINQRPGKKAERWTLDGELLNDVLFFSEIEKGDTLFKDRDRRNNPLPEFSDTMLLVDIPNYLESSLRVSKGISTFDITVVEPTQFLGKAAVRFDFQALGADDILRRGRAVAGIVDGKLFMMTYEAPAVYFYERNLQDFDQLVESAHID